MPLHSIGRRNLLNMNTFICTSLFLNMANRVVQLFLLFHFLGLTEATTASVYKSWLTDSSGPYQTYNRKIFPRTAQSSNVEVSVNFSLIAITEFDEVGGAIELIGFLTVQWTNELLTWSTGTYSLTSLLLPQDYLWRPSLIVSNSVESLAELGHSSYLIRIDNGGNHEWTVGIVTKTACSVDVTYYPFDKQSCDIVFNPWGYSDSQIALTSRDSAVDLTHYQTNAEWSIMSSSVSTSVVSAQSYLTFTFNLDRTPGYFVVNMLIPILILGLLNGLVFVLPADSGERVGYAITAFLTYAVFLSLVSDNLPKASEPMSLLCYFLTIMLVLSATSSLVTIVILRVYGQEDDSEVPKCIRVVVAYMKCDKCKKHCCKNKEKPEGLEYDSDDDDSLEETRKDETRYITWKVVARVLDNFFFISFLIVTCCLSIFFLIPIAVASQ